MLQTRSSILNKKCLQLHLNPNPELFFTTQCRFSRPPKSRNPRIIKSSRETAKFKTGKSQANETLDGSACSIIITSSSKTVAILNKIRSNRLFIKGGCIATPKVDRSHREYHSHLFILPIVFNNCKVIVENATHSETVVIH